MKNIGIFFLVFFGMVYLTEDTKAQKIEDFKDIYGKDLTYVEGKLGEPHYIPSDFNLGYKGYEIWFQEGKASSVHIHVSEYSGEYPFGITKDIRSEDLQGVSKSAFQDGWYYLRSNESNEPSKEDVSIYFKNGKASTCNINLVSLLDNNDPRRQGGLKKLNNVPTNNFNPASPPIISIVNNNLTFKDATGNNDIDAYENTSLRFEIQNKGKGIGDNLKIKLSAKGSTSGISFSESTLIPALKAGGTYAADIPITANGNTQDGSVTFTVLVDEPHGLGSDPVDIEIPTRAFVAPLVKVVDYSVTGSSGSNLARKQPFDLQVLVQNTKPGTAQNVIAEIEVPDNILLIAGDQRTDIGSLKAGATKDILYTVIVTDHYTASSIPITIKLNENYGKYAENKNITLNLNQALAANKITVQAVANNNPIADIKEASLRAEVDKDIPVNASKNNNTYALVIGNENYADFQSDISAEANVDFARNDARVFNDYCQKTLGIPAGNITLLTDATAGKMKQAIDKLKTLVKNSEGNLQVVFYYAGHGLPDESTHEPFLVPVDVSGKDLSSAIKMADVYKMLTTYPSKGVTVFLDACFSGGARNQPLIAARAVKIKPKEEMLSGRITVFTASSGDETSWPYKDKQHGIFTYFLLKKLQDSKGDVTYADLGKYLNQQVKFQSVKINSKEQEPQLIYSAGITSDELDKIKLKDGFK